MKVEFMESGEDAHGLCSPVSREGLTDLYLTKYSMEDIGTLTERYRALLSDGEKEQERRFLFAEDQRRYLVTRALVRTVLSRYFELDPAQWRFKTNLWGKPEIANEDALEMGIQFNVSHTKGLIALAVTRSRAVGVDVENTAIREGTLLVAQHYFTDEEASMLRNLHITLRQERFFTLWTLKEAYIKARGLGLSIPLNQFCFQFSGPNRIAFAPLTELQDRAEHWQFWLFRPTAGYLLALCARCSASPTISAKWVVPLAKEEAVQLQVLRISQ